MKRKFRWIKNDIGKIPPRDFGSLRLRRLNANRSSQLLSLMQVSLGPGKSHEKVCHKWTHEWIYLLKGSAVAHLGKHSSKLLLKPGSTLYVPPGIWHSFKANKNGVEALSIFFPPLDRKKPDIETWKG